MYPVDEESARAEHPAVDDVCVFMVPDEHCGEADRAVMVLRTDHVATDIDLLSFANERRASFKVPRTVEIRDDLMEEPIGKILKRAHKAEYRSDEGES